MVTASTMNLELVAMPWAMFDAPSAALGVLSAYLQGHEPRVKVRCRNAFVDLWRRIPGPYEAISAERLVGDLVYAVVLYPERRQDTVRAIEDILAAASEVNARGGLRSTGAGKIPWDRVFKAVEEHLEATAQQMAAEADVVGCSTTVTQLFSSLCLARRIKELKPQIRIVLGGSSAHVAGASLLDVYPFVDAVVRGEGEERLVALLRAWLGDRPIPGSESGILTRGTSPPAAGTPVVVLSDPEDLDALPVPDYDDYTERAEAASIYWTIPIEGSRGCWWNRAPRTGNPLHACYFCGFNLQSARRDKSPARIASEMGSLADRYRNMRFFFRDNVLRQSGVSELCQALRQGGRRFSFSVELRASITAAEIAELFQSGCVAVQVGVEGLSTAYLRRMNKGTTTIQNLCAMRACCEFEIRNGANLLIDFPGATCDEVDETVRVIENYACAYEPPSIAVFTLNPCSSVGVRPEMFGVSRMGAHPGYLAALPADIASRLELPWRGHELLAEPVSWDPVLVAVKRWRRHFDLLKRSRLAGVGSKALAYTDGGEFLEIVDRRKDFQVFTLDKSWRDIYLFCTNIRSEQEIAHRFDGALSHQVVVDQLGEMVDAKLMFREGDRFLSLAVAVRPELALLRIREEQASATPEAAPSPTR
jgi:ribosomal peptide maturation radical SAM protein 1